HWLAWALFQTFGYAAFLFPLLLGLWAGSTFVRPLVPRGWAPAVGLVIVLVSTTALLTQSSPALPGDDISAGGLVGWSLTEGLRGRRRSPSARTERSRFSCRPSACCRRRRRRSSRARARSSRTTRRRCARSSRTSTSKAASCR